ncbi:ribose import ATP-binding protein RbsA [Peptococcaceae bacterium CEB3]|nr:ribose import ATP-binding protein RbsA [Peptococcaceae bacterium CEB3]
MDILKMVNISKSFNGTAVLKDVSFEVRAGEVHALIGENGAGKSTLIKIAAGVYNSDDGETFFDGREVQIGTPADAHRLGIFTVHQEPSVMPNLSVAENVLMGFHPYRRFAFRWVDKKAMYRKTEEVFGKLGLKMDVRRNAGELTIAQQQMLEIAKALVHDVRVLILDEPTATLSDHETGLLFEIVRRLRDQGTAVIFVSHRLHEVFSLSDRITVMRDGEKVATSVAASLSEQELVRLMVGRELRLGSFESRATNREKPLLQVSGLSNAPWFDDVSFALYPGEVLAMAGLVGSGRTNVAEAIFGIQPARSGQVVVNGEALHMRSIKQALEHGIAYIPEDRHKHGVALAMSLRANVTLVNVPARPRLGCIDRRREIQISAEAVQRLNIKAQGVEQPVGQLSGGNQQKVVLAKWLAAGPKIIILDEPTRGVDVGAKGEIHRIIDGLAREGNAVLVISSDLPEILVLADRTLVMHEGRLVGELHREDTSEESIMALATGTAIRTA